MLVRVWFVLVALTIFGLVAMGWAQENETPKTEKLDGTVKGIIVGLNRVTLAVLSSRQVMSYLHTSQEKLPPWLRTGMEVTVHYRRESDGSLWIEQISPYKPPEQTPSTVTPAFTQMPITSFLTFSTVPQTSPPAQTTVQSRQGSIETLRERQLTSRGLTSALRIGFRPSTR